MSTEKLQSKVGCNWGSNATQPKASLFPRPRGRGSRVSQGTNKLSPILWGFWMGRHLQFVGMSLMSTSLVWSSSIVQVRLYQNQPPLFCHKCICVCVCIYMHIYARVLCMCCIHVFLINIVYMHNIACTHPIAQIYVHSACFCMNTYPPLVNSHPQGLSPWGLSPTSILWAVT